jgi:pimeloyl-ACP methyl ester carboxylesterase
LRHTADDAHAFIEALGLERPVVMGHSWGGATAMVLASGAWSELPVPKLSRLILEDPAVNFGRGDAEERAVNYTKDIGRPAEELRPEIMAANPGWTEADVEGKIEALHKVTREAVLSVFAEAGEAGNILPLLAKIAVPTLLVRADPTHGSTLDDVAWEQAKEYLSAPSRAVQIDGATHNIHRGMFDEFMRVADDFLG